MEPNINKKDTREFIKGIPAWNYDLVSDFGQDEMRKKQRVAGQEQKDNLNKQIVRFSEDNEKLIHEC